MHPLAPVFGKNVSLSLRRPTAFMSSPAVLVSAISGRCSGIEGGKLLVVQSVTAAFDPSGKDVTTDAKLAGSTVALRLGNIKNLVYDGS